MAQFPLGADGLSLWLAFTSTILLIASELLSSSYGTAGLILNGRRLRAVALTMALLFLITIAYRIYGILTLANP